MLIKKLTSGTVTRLQALVINNVDMAYSALLLYFFAKMAIADIDGSAQSNTTVLEMFSAIGVNFRTDQTATGNKTILKRIKMYISQFIRYFLILKKQKSPPMYIMESAGVMFPSGAKAKNITSGSFKPIAIEASEKIIANKAGFMKLFKHLKLYVFRFEASFTPKVQSINWSTTMHRDIKIPPSLPYSAKISGIPMKPAFEKVAMAL